MNGAPLMAWLTDTWCLLIPLYILAAAASLAVPVALVVIAACVVRLTRAYEQSVRQKGAGPEDRK